MAEQNRKSRTPMMRPFLRVLLIVVFLGFTLSSGLLGFQLGRSASRATGRLVDTIVLSPSPDAEEGPAALPPTAHFLTGRVLRQDSTPCAGVTVRLRDEDRSDVTDTQGKFYFSEMHAGTHTLEVLDDAGEPLTDLEITLDFSADEEVSADVAADPVVFRMPEDTRLLELTVTVDEEENSAAVAKESAYFVTQDGVIVNFNGTALQVKEETLAVTPQGNVVVASGSVLIPSKAVVITPAGSVQEADPGEEVLPGAVLEEDGAVVTEEGASLLATGEVELPGGETLDGGAVVEVTQDEVRELEELPEAYVPMKVRRTMAVQAAPAAAQTEENAAGPQEDPAEETAEALQAVGAAEEEDDSPREGLVFLQDGQVVQPSSSGSGRKGAAQQWQQLSTIDLFQNRTDNLNLGEDENGVPIAAPGSKGYYEFRLENPESYDIVYTISIRELSFHLPVRYSVINARNNISYLYRSRIVDGALTSDEILIPAESSMDFRVDWDWSYEDWFQPEKDDVLDTEAVLSEDRTYLVGLVLSARQTTNSDESLTPGDDVQYPGKR